MVNLYAEVYIQSVSTNYNIYTGTTMVEVVREVKSLGEVVAKLAGEPEGEVSGSSFFLDRCMEDYNPH